MILHKKSLFDFGRLDLGQRAIDLPEGLLLVLELHKDIFQVDYYFLGFCDIFLFVLHNGLPLPTSRSDTSPPANWHSLLSYPSIYPPRPPLIPRPPPLLTPDAPASATGLIASLSPAPHTRCRRHHHLKQNFPMVFTVPPSFPSGPPLFSFQLLLSTPSPPAPSSCAVSSWVWAASRNYQTSFRESTWGRVYIFNSLHEIGSEVAPFGFLL